MKKLAFWYSRDVPDGPGARFTRKWTNKCLADLRYRNFGSVFAIIMPSRITKRIESRPLHLRGNRVCPKRNDQSYTVFSVTTLKFPIYIQLSVAVGTILKTADFPEHFRGNALRPGKSVNSIA